MSLKEWSAKYIVIVNIVLYRTDGKRTTKINNLPLALIRSNDYFEKAFESKYIFHCLLKQKALIRTPQVVARGRLRPQEEEE